jgi:hypothetical protein
MGRTNASIVIQRKTTDWDQSETITPVGTYDVWIDEKLDVTGTARGLDVSPSLIEMGRGLVILWDDLELSGCSMIYNTVEYQILRTWRFATASGFHHMEFVYA